jgi:ADP-heptose:LPS heptosyltransferase
VRGADAEARRYTRLWQDDASVAPEPGVDLVVDHVGGTESYRRNLAAMFPGATVTHEPPPVGGEEGREWVAAHPLAAAEPRANPNGPVILHIGAGSESKRWPLDRWEELLAAHRARGIVTVLVAGEVEADRLPRTECSRFEALGGRFLRDVAALAEILKSGRLFIGSDSGPAHLAAQLGVPTLALFGPSDSRAWAPIGPVVRVLAQAGETDMRWLGVDQVAAAAAEMLLADRRT